MSYQSAKDVEWHAFPPPAVGTYEVENSDGGMYPKRYWYAHYDGVEFKHRYARPEEIDPKRRATHDNNKQRWRYVDQDSKGATRTTRKTLLLCEGART